MWTKTKSEVLSPTISILIFLSLLFLSPDLKAETLNKEALATIQKFANDICGEYWREGGQEKLMLSGELEARLNGLLRKLSDLGIEGSVTFDSKRYEGVLHEDLASEFRNIRECKLQVWRDLRDSILEKKPNSGYIPNLSIEPEKRGGSKSEQRIQIKNTGGSILNLSFNELSCLRASWERCGTGGFTNYIFPIKGGHGTVLTGDPRQPADRTTVITVYSRPEWTKKWLEDLADRLGQSGFCPGPGLLTVAVKITFDDIRGGQHRRYFEFNQSFETDSIMAGGSAYKPKPFQWMQQTPTHWKDHEQWINFSSKYAIKSFGGGNYSLRESELNRAASRIRNNE